MLRYRIIITLQMLLIISIFTSAATVPARYVITDYGAVADGQTLNTRAIQSVIDLCASQGGGTIEVPEGTFLSGAIFLRQGVDLFIRKGGVLKPSINNPGSWLMDRL